MYQLTLILKVVVLRRVLDKRLNEKFLPKEKNVIKKLKFVKNFIKKKFQAKEFIVKKNSYKKTFIKTFLRKKHFP